jgi:ATP-dependent helicase HrpA
MEVKRDGHILMGYPAIVDAGDAVQIQVFDDPREASRVHWRGLRRLFALQMKETIRYLEKNIPAMQQMAVHFMPLGTLEELRDQIICLAIERSSMQGPLVNNQRAFVERAAEGKNRVSLLAQEIARLVGRILAEFSGLARKLGTVRAHAAAAADIEVQLEGLMARNFVLATPYEQLVHLPRYLQAIALRIDKLRSDPGRDARMMADMAPLLQRWQRASAQRKGDEDERLASFRWLLEELRVALFAQELRTPMSVSVKRLQKVWDSMSH